MFETQENAPSGLDGMVTASIVPTTVKIVPTNKMQGQKVRDTHNSLLVVKSTNIPSKHANIVSSNTIKANQTPLNTSAQVGVVTLSNSKRDIQHVATLGDGGPQFQPTPESGQAFNPAFLDRTFCQYIREEKIPLYVWNQKEYCKDYKACLSQSEEVFGYVPLTDLKVYTGPPAKWDTVPLILSDKVGAKFF